MTVLLIEDDPIDRKLLIAVLSESGHQVLAPTLPAEALETLQHTSPDVILLDLNLSPVDGLSLARQIKSVPARRHIPIVAITAALESFSRQAALEAGCEDYIVKPIDTRTLPGQLARLVERRPTSHECSDR